ncbi:hypothetical protein F5X68DRAFT_271272 [Plectosphaerella plurivora]|uniref:RRM domain-containing protein n=1 Tax=Plectosphaerella plurivora TaxID=936078 RepID=A0A9P8V221_9PEZI|nr:hypothetical protein F5X68DRAFT_271272 [Plectosphaerella plurivora]
MAPSLPVGEDKWLDYIAEHNREATDLEKRVNVIELFKLAVDAEPSSLKVWCAYCKYFWSLHVDSQSGDAGWSDEDQLMGREIFSLNAALSLWQQGYEAIQYRINDSHELWDTWISLERGLLDRTRTPEGLRRITHLYSDRLQVPHVTHKDTSQAFSGFLSTYNNAAHEETMQSITEKSQDAMRLVENRDELEEQLRNAQQRAADDEYRDTLKTYVEWEVAQSKRSSKHMEASGDLCRGLFSRALTGVFAFDEGMWSDYIRFLSVSGAFAQAPLAMLDVIRRAVDHCPWSGALWSRYILSAEEARLPFHDIEQIKHKATSHPDLYKNGLSALLDIYAGWCGFLKRTAMDLNATDEAVDVADMGLPNALESVEQARRRYAPEYRGDPAFRLERIYIQYLTEKKRCVDEAREQWYTMAENQLYADSYDFWLQYYLWEMMVFASNGKDRSPTPSTAAVGLRVPSLATSVLGRAVKKKSLDWPERIMEVYMQHCNDYELPSVVRNATDIVSEVRKEVKKRRDTEQQQAAELYAAQFPQQVQPAESASGESPSASKRKRGDGEDPDATAETANKRQKNHGEDGRTTEGGQRPKRDRENTSVLVMNIPAEVTQTKIRQYFREYGHINSIATVQDASGDTQTVFLEFRTPEEAQSALLRDGKYMGEAQIAVQPGTDLTVYATNYPPTFGPDDIRKLFKDCGDIISIRMPSLKGNVRRRFSYITFRTLDASTKATQKTGMSFQGGFKLAKKREGAVEEGRELHVTDLDPAASEDDLKSVFSKFGNVLRVSIPRNKAGKAHGTAYVELETKVQAESAASELNKTKFRNTIMSVRVSTPMTFKRSAATSNDRASTPAGSSKDNEGDESMPDLNGGTDPEVISKDSSHQDVADRTIALLDIPDTVNDARMKTIVQPLSGFKSLVLQPSHGGARVEFEDPASAGRAALQLDGYVLDGRKLRTGTLDELRHGKGEVRTDMIQYGVGRKDNKTKAASNTNFAPSTVKRPVLGKGGAKRGLGFVSKKSTAAPSKTNGVAKEGDSTAEQSKPMRSNADFKAMFVKSEAAPQTSTAAAEDKGTEKKPAEGSA